MVDFQIIFNNEKQLDVFLKVENARSFDYKSYEDNELRFFIKGVLINEQDLINKYAISEEENLIKTIYQKKGNKFSDLLVGEFCGFLVDKRQSKLLVFTNLLGSQRVFYYKKGGYLVIDTNIFSLKKYLDHKKLSYSEDLNSAYSLLALSNLLENNTLISEVKKLRSSEQILIDLETGHSELETVAPLQNIEYFQGNKSSAIDQLDELFSIAVRQEYEKDLSIKRKHFSLLSGGLDSRLGIFYAMKLGFAPKETLCFSHSNYWDEKIAKQISRDYDINLKVVHLDDGNYLKDVDEITSISQGLTQYTGGVHSNYALHQVDFSELGLVHSGHLGDAVLGSYLSAPERKAPQNALQKLISNKKMVFKINDHLQTIANNYDSEELFLLHNRGFNYIVIGAYVAEQFSWQLSPFMHNDFLRFALSLPEKWKYNQALYIEWINKHCKPATNYIWERTLMRPNKKWKTNFGTNMLSRAYKIYFDKISKQSYKTNMVSYDFYYQSDELIQQFFRNYFLENIHLIKDEELKKDVSEMFNNGHFKEKSMVLTLLGAYKELYG